MLQRRLLLGHNFSQEPLVGCVKHETNEIILPENNNPKSPDLKALEMFRNVVRVKRGMSIFRHYKVREWQANGPKENVIAADSDTDLEHELPPLLFEVQVNAPLIVPPPPELLNNADENDPDTDSGFAWHDLILIISYYMLLIYRLYNYYI